MQYRVKDPAVVVIGDGPAVELKRGRVEANEANEAALQHLVALGLATEEEEMRDAAEP